MSKIHLTKIDYKDTFDFTTENNSLSIQEIYIKVFSSAPKWVDFMLNLRNKIVGLFGLKTDVNENNKADFKVGDKVGIFKIYEILENEIIAGEDDKHLDFRVSVLRKVGPKSIISITTTVQYNNWFGKLYFTVVKPFHKLILKSLMRSAAKRF